MKVSVVIPAYNAAETIRATIESVLRQTEAPYEILVLDDGSTDATSDLLRSYGSRLRVFHQQNAGVASALNRLFQLAGGDVLAILGADDIWHPEYLAAQAHLYQEYPSAAALFTGHVDFFGTGDYEWKADMLTVVPRNLVLSLPKFIKLYNSTPGAFANMSHCCIPRAVLGAIGPEPFQLRMAEDLYFFNRLALATEGSIVYYPAPLVAYRVRHGSLSSNRLLLNEHEVRVFELLVSACKKNIDSEIRRAFRESFAIKRRQYAKVLLGAGMAQAARRQLWLSLSSARNATSMAKSLGLLALGCLPRRFQPQWPGALRELKSPDYIRG